MVKRVNNIRKTRKLKTIIKINDYMLNTQMKWIVRIMPINQIEI
jgi:hypothetical protein